MPAVQLPSVKSLLCEMRFGDRILSTGTGFVVRNGATAFLLTNRHNVTGRRNDSGELLSKTGGVPDNIVIHHHVSGRLGVWEARQEPLFALDGAPLWREHPLHGRRADVVALPLKNIEGVDLYPYELTDEPRIAVAPGDIVSVVGFPFGMSTGGMLPIWATGFVASEPQVGVNASDLPIFYIDCRSRQGQSGSAVIAHRSGGMVALEGGNSAVFDGPVTRLLGIYSGRVNAESDIGIVWRTSALHGLVEDTTNFLTKSFPLSAIKTNW
ncbi:S1 family peptidase [Cognatilysobacter segetis]|uniref:S1 family peptidase n=1 Tax=Cognatilysobacter segetis TaxID=2492394 RepID=UPI00192E464B|nr:serine protease [Lysobacter segetis]